MAVVVVFGMALLLNNPFNFASASTTIQANICRTSYTAPIITEPAQAVETKDPSIVVKGTGEPDMTIMIVDNGTNVGSATVGGDGSFALQVPLIVGDNTLIARETDGCTTHDSGAVNIHRTAIPPFEQPSGSTQSARDATLPKSGSNFSLGDGESALSPSLPSGTPQTGEQSGSTSGAIILQPHDGAQFSEGQIWVRGTASPGGVVTIFLNGREVARVVAGEDGSFAVMITLKPGDNTIQAVVENEGQSIASREIRVRFNQGASTANSVEWSKIVGITVVVGIPVVTTGFLIWRIRRNRGSDT